MKNTAYVLISLLLTGLFCTSCQKNKGGDIVPDNFGINLSDAISIPDLDKKALILNDTIASGKDLYQHLRTLIFVGEYSSELINESLWSIKDYIIDRAMSFSYISDRDNRTKNVVVREQVSFENETWDYEMTITDEIEGKAFLLYWNMNPLKVIAFLQPKAMNFQSLVLRRAIIRVNYNDSDPIFDKTMLVMVTGIDSTSVNFMKKLKMFAGQKGDVVHIYGNTIHPYAYLVDPNYIGGRAWTFRAKNNTKLDIAVAKVALPPISLTNDEMPPIWDEYSMDKILEEEIVTVYNDATPSIIENYVYTARGVAYFVGPPGFVSNGTDIPQVPGFTPEFIDMTGLEPWAPVDVNNLTIGF